MSEHLATPIVNALQRIADALETLAADATERQAVERARRTRLLAEYDQLRAARRQPFMRDALTPYDVPHEQLMAKSDAYWKQVDTRAERAQAAAQAFEERYPEVAALAEAAVA